MSLTRTRGGISTLIDEILRSDLKDDFAVRYLESQAEDFGAAAKLALAVRAFIVFLGALVFRRPALVYVHVGSNASLYRESFFLLPARLLGVRSIAHFHAGDVDEYLARQSAAGRRLIAFALGRADRLLAVSRDSAAKLRRLVPAGRIDTLVNAIDARRFAFPADRFAARGAAAPVRILFVGAMGRLKGEKDLADAVAFLAARRGNLRVSFLGFGGEELRAYCRARGLERLVEFVGPVAAEDRFAHFERADIFALPTYAEAMPVAVIEAMAAGLPVVATTVGGIPELIADGAEGFLVAPSDVEALAARLATLIADRERRLRMGARARAKVARELDFEIYTKKLKALLAEAAAGE